MPELNRVVEDILTEAKTSRKPQDIDVKKWVLKNFHGPDGARLQICHLWDNYFRVNYWLEKKSNNIFKEEEIVLSKFLEIKNV